MGSFDGKSCVKPKCGVNTVLKSDATCLYREPVVKAKKEFGNKKKENEKDCVKDKDRVVSKECSSLKICFANGKYNNKLCESDESCSKFGNTGKSGCIAKNFCGIEADDQSGKKVNFICPGGTEKEG